MPFNLFGKKAGLAVQTDRTSYQPGEAMTVLVTVQGEDELDIEEGRVELICTNRYTYRYERTTDEGRRSVEETTASDDKVVTVQRFLEAGTIDPGSVAEHRVTVPLPAGVPASGAGAITAVSWKVRAALNVKRASDPEAEMPITVLAPAAAHADRAQSPPQSDAALAADLAFDLPTRSLRPGDSLAGTFRVIPQTEIDAQEVRVELVRREEVRRSEGLTRETVAANAAFGGDATLQPGQQREFPFALTVPTDACPTLETEQTSVRWLLRGVVGRRFRGDYTLTAELNVYTGT